MPHCDCRGLSKNDPNPDCPQHGLDAPPKPLPVMQQPGYVFRARKHIVARNIRVGDRVAESGRSPTSEKWEVTEIDVRPAMIWVRYKGWSPSRFTALALLRERVWIDRVE